MFSGPHNRMILNDMNTTEGPYDNNNESPSLLFTSTSSSSNQVSPSNHHIHHIHQQSQDHHQDDDLHIQFYNFQHPVNHHQISPQLQPSPPPIHSSEYKKVSTPRPSRKTREEHLERKRIRAKERRFLEKQQKIMQKQQLDEQEKIETREKLLKAPLVGIPEDSDFDNYEITSVTDIKDLLVEFRKTSGIVKTKEAFDSINETFLKLYSGKSVSVTRDTETLESTHQAGESTTITKTTITTVVHSKKPLLKFTVSQFCQFWKLYYRAFMVPYHAKVTPYKRPLICALESHERIPPIVQHTEILPENTLPGQIDSHLLVLPTSSNGEEQREVQSTLKKRKRSKHDNCQVKFILYFSVEDKLIFLERFNDVDHEHILDDLLERCKISSYKTLDEIEREKLKASEKASERLSQVSSLYKRKYGPFYTKKLQQKPVDTKKLKMLPKQLENSAISQFISVLSFNGNSEKVQENNSHNEAAVASNFVDDHTLKLAPGFLDTEVSSNSRFETRSQTQSPQSKKQNHPSAVELEEHDTETQEMLQFRYGQFNEKISSPLGKSDKQKLQGDDKQREIYFETAVKNRKNNVPKHVMVNEDGTLSDDI